MTNTYPGGYWETLGFPWFAGILAMRWRPTIVLLVLIDNTAFAQSQAPGGMPPPPGMSLAASAAMRVPQPVRVGDLLHRRVLQPVESQNYLGRVQQVVRDKDAAPKVVIDYGGLLGFGARQIAVPVDAMVLVGQVIKVVANTPKQLAQFPTFTADSSEPVSEDAIIKVGLAKPSH